MTEFLSNKSSLNASTLRGGGEEMEMAEKISPQALIKPLLESACTYSGLLLETRWLLLGKDESGLLTDSEHRKLFLLILLMPRILTDRSRQSVILCVEPKINFPKHSEIQTLLTQHWSAKKCQDRGRSQRQKLLHVRSCHLGNKQS